MSKRDSKDIRRAWAKRMLRGVVRLPNPKLEAARDRLEAEYEKQQKQSGFTARTVREVPGGMTAQEAHR